MMHARMVRPAAILAALSMSAGMLLAGCDLFASVVSDCPSAPAPGIAVVVGNRANSPVPAIPMAALDERLPALIDRSRHDKENNEATVGVDVIRLDGRPVITCVVKLDVNTNNPPADRDAEKKFRDDIASRVSEVQAQTEEADVLGALSLAAKSVGKGGTIILVDSGLQTVDPLNFTVPHLIGNEPDQILDRLVRITPLPDLTGRTVILAGIGYTAAPQMPLHEGQRQLLIRLWEALAQRGGATVVVVPQPNTDASAPGRPRVTTIAVPDPGTVRFACNSETILRNDGAVGFVPNQTVFLDKDSARGALTDLASFLSTNPDATVTLTGNIAHYGTDLSLAHRRALAVRDLLVQLGVPSNRINAVGDGWGPYPSRTAGPDPAFDQQNRRVVVAVRCA